MLISMHRTKPSRYLASMPPLVDHIRDLRHLVRVLEAQANLEATEPWNVAEDLDVVAYSLRRIARQLEGNANHLREAASRTVPHLQLLSTQ